MCLVSWSGRENDFPQPFSAQRYGRSPVCVRSFVVIQSVSTPNKKPLTCFDKFEDSANALFSEQ